MTQEKQDAYIDTIIDARTMMRDADRGDIPAEYKFDDMIVALEDFMDEDDTGTEEFLSITEDEDVPELIHQLNEWLSNYHQRVAQRDREVAEWAMEERLLWEGYQNSQ